MFLRAYEQQNILERDPFVSIDVDGVGELVKIAAERGRKTRPAIKLGICGEHGGDPASVRFCAEVGLDYVSCSPFRVPIARLAAAQASLTAKVVPLGKPARKPARKVAGRARGKKATVTSLRKAAKKVAARNGSRRRLVRG
jgi:phosphoenolpyruvate-protein kinase (PTS system EI component)